MNVILEYIIVYIIVYVFNYFILIRNNTKYRKDRMPTEILYLKKMYNININKNNYKHFLYVYGFTNTFIITTIYIILMYLINNWILRIVLGVVLLILLIIICYGLLGRYYSKKEGDRDV